MSAELPRQKPVRRLYRRWWLLPPFGLLAAALVCAVVWPRGPELVPYVSPPLDASGARLHMLVPRGWAVHFDPPGRAEDAAPGVTNGLITVTPPDSWLPRSLRRWLPSTEEDLITMAVAFTRWRRSPAAPCYFETMVGAQDMAGRTLTWLAIGGRQSPDHTTWFTLQYYRGSRATLDRTAPAIFRSLRVDR